MTKIYAIVGRKTAGKDTLAAIIKNRLMEHGGKTVWFKSFAGPMKATLVTLCGFPDITYFNDQDKKERLWPAFCDTHTPRQLMEWFGTDVIRQQFGKDFWVRRLIADVEATAGENDVVIITDARFTNEVALLHAKYGEDLTVVYVDAEERLGPLPPGASAPEAAVAETLEFLRGGEIPYVHVNNNGSLEFLRMHSLFLLKLLD
jgi:hypothetical protein